MEVGILETVSQRVALHHLLPLLHPRLPMCNLDDAWHTSDGEKIDAWSVQGTDQLAICHLGDHVSKERSCNHLSVSRLVAHTWNQQVARPIPSPNRELTKPMSQAVWFPKFDAMPIIVCGWKEVRPRSNLSL